jgi:hypothetical protein
MNSNPAQAEPTDKTNKVLVSVVLDRSSSMGSCRDKTIEGYNEYLNALRTDKESEYNITLIQFDHAARSCDLTICYVDRPIADVPDLTRDSYEPRGSTPLYDAIGECIRRVEAKGRAVINVIITDGEENSSHEFTLETIKALVKQKEAESQTFVFLGANIDAFAVGTSFGAQAMNVSNYAVGQSAAAFANTAHSTIMRAAAARTMGVSLSVKEAFYDDTQRASNMGLPHTTPPSGLRPTGGRPAAPSTFRGKSPKDTQVDGKSKREWKTSNV